MLFELSQDALEKIKVDALIIPWVKDGKKDPSYFRQLDESVDGGLSQRMQDTEFKGDLGKILACNTMGLIAPKVVYLVGLGETDKFNAFVPTRAYASAIRAVLSDKGTSAAILYFENDIVENFFQKSIEGILLGTYKFREYQSDKKKNRREIGTVKILYRDKKVASDIKRQIDAAQVVADSTNLARDLVNRPANDLYPETLAQVCRQTFKGKPYSLNIWDGKEIQKKKMMSFFSVSRGSIRDPRFIHINYKPTAKPKKRIVLIGKGVTYDTGGLSLKPAKGMIDMKCDMAGAAAVIGTLKAAKELKLPFEIDGIIAATENVIGLDSTKPGDIVYAMNGKSIEVLNTDAEGRLTLADALCYACDLPRVDSIIDLATLTGACLVALGDMIAGGMTNDDTLLQELIKAGEAAGEKIWHLPLPEEYRDSIKSDIADLKNIGGDGGYGGTLIGGLFLQEFVTCKSWAHLDIAGPAFLGKDLGYCTRGGSGFGVRTLINYLQNLA